MSMKWYNDVDSDFEEIPISRCPCQPL